MAPSRFNVQSFLAEMRSEQREDAQHIRTAHDELSTKVEQGFKACTEAIAVHVLEDTKQFSAIDNRLAIIENGRRATKWLVGVLVTLVLGAAIDFLFVHVKP